MIKLISKGFIIERLSNYVYTVLGYYLLIFIETLINKLSIAENTRNFVGKYFAFMHAASDSSKELTTLFKTV